VVIVMKCHSEALHLDRKSAELKDLPTYDR
jgi:hypothetical protein